MSRSRHPAPAPPRSARPRAAPAHGQVPARGARHAAFRDEAWISAEGGLAEVALVYDGGALAVVDKPAGLLSQGDASGAPSLVDWARARWGGRAAVLHRLDRNVSGLVLVAEAGSIADALSRAFGAGQVERSYRAVSCGVPPELAEAGAELLIDAPLEKDARTNEVRVVAPGRGQAARTRVVVLACERAPLGPLASLEVTLDTGRSHQIRVHLAHVGLPIVGDPKYGVAARVLAPWGAPPGARAAPLRRPLLHASRLTFVHPATGERVVLAREPPWPRELSRRLARPAPARP